MNYGILLLSTALFMQSAYAKPCRNLEGNSCWHAVNQTNQSVEISCTYFERILREIFVSGPIPQASVYSYQFDQGMSEGLGFAVSNLDCESRYGHAVKKVHIPVMPLGAHIKFVIESRKLRAIVQSSWGQPYRKEYESAP